MAHHVTSSQVSGVAATPSNGRNEVDDGENDGGMGEWMMRRILRETIRVTASRNRTRSKADSIRNGRLPRMLAAHQ